MRSIYFDHASTSFPKAPGVVAAISEYLDRNGRNIGRGNYRPAYEAAETVLTLREVLSEFFGGPGPRNTILTPGCTYALNQVLTGLLRPGDRVVTSSVEHNAIARPLHRLEAEGVTVEYLPCDETGALLNGWEQALTPNTRLVVMTHACNVSGTLLPIEQVGRLCQKRGIFLCVDAAQTAGAVPIHMGEFGIDALAVPGHKGLLGPQGIGALLLTDKLAAELQPLTAGGTGSWSNRLDMPEVLPDRFEAGTLNLPGIYGLLAALQHLKCDTPENRRQREIRLTGHLLARLREMEVDGLRVLGPADARDRIGVVSVDFPHMDNAEAAYRLEKEFGIQTRCGIQCAPLAHMVLGTYPHGTVRFSVGASTRFEDIDYIHGAVCNVMGV